MSFKSSFFAIPIFIAVMGFSALAWAQASSPETADPGRSCGSGAACICREYSKAAVNHDCLNEPVSGDRGNPLVNEESQKGIESTKKLIGSKQATVGNSCDSIVQTTDESLTLMNKIHGICSQWVDKCAAACPKATGPEAAANGAKCDEAKNLKTKMESDIAQMQALQDKNKACSSDVNGEKSDQAKEEKEDGGGGMSMPSFPTAEKDACATSPTSAACQQQVQNCSNPEYAAGNEVCRCFNNPGGCSKSEVVEPTERKGFSSASDESSSSSSSGDEFGSRSSGSSSGAGGGGGLPSPGGGGGGRGSSSGANKPTGVVYENDPATINANILAGVRGSSGAAGAAKSGTYSDNGNWIPPSVKGRKLAADDPTALSLTKRAQLCSPTNQPSRDNFQQIHVRAICTMGLDPK